MARPADFVVVEEAMTKHCKGCVYHNIGKRGTKHEDWCTRHSNFAKKARSICILQGTKKLREVKP
jgi:hypothetical protein